MTEGQRVKQTQVALPPSSKEWSSAMQQQRRRLKLLKSLEERLAEDAKRLREQAKSLPSSAVREALLRKARQAETGSHISEWLSSPGLQPPKHV